MGRRASSGIILMIHVGNYSLKSLEKVLAAFLLTSAALACDTGPPLPKEMSFEGRLLDRATEWSSGELAGVVFVPPGETLPTASLQVGILVSQEHSSGVELHNWVMQRYHESPTARWYESSIAGEACKVGLGPGPRPFVALHVCRSASGVSACAEADERLGDEIVGRCLNRTNDCWDELCSRMWGSRRAALEAEVYGVLGSR